MDNTTTTHGIIVGIEDHGTIVSLVVAETSEQLAEGIGRYVNFDHTPFRWIVESETSGNPFDLIGRGVYVDVSGGADVVYFDEIDDVQANVASPDEPATLDEMFGCDPWDDEHFGKHAASRRTH